MGSTSKKTTSSNVPARRARRSSAPPSEAQQPSAPGNGNAAAPTAPSDEEIARLAYRYYEESGHIPGRDVENWLRAVAELSQRR